METITWKLPSKEKCRMTSEVKGNSEQDLIFAINQRAEDAENDLMDALDLLEQCREAGLLGQIWDRVVPFLKKFKNHE